MTWAHGLAGLLLAAVGGSPVFSFHDPAITESSGLVDLGALMVTTNDSGGDPLVFVIDGSGRTVGRTTYAAAVVDTEALAPAGPDAVWVGDIGDNDAVRSRVQVYRVPIAAGDRTVAAPAYDLVYPDGAHDAESLLYGTDGRLRIVTKGVLGGRVYVAPKKLDPHAANRLVAGPDVSLWATDAALFPDGKHVLVRGYGDAMVATYPGFDPIGYLDLPEQEQGEGVSIGSDGRIRLSSEGAGSRVLEIRLPAPLVKQLAPSRPAHPGPAVASSKKAEDDSSVWPWILGGTLAMAGIGWLAARRRG